MGSEVESVIVTGAASGIGDAVVREMLGHGYAVEALDRDRASLEAASAEWNGDYSLYECDVADESSVQLFFSSVVERGRTLRGLVNAAGIREIEFPLDLTTHEWTRVLSVNLTGTFLMCREAAPLLAAGGSIVNISSSAGLFGITHRAAYSSSKHGVIGLTKTLAHDLGATLGVRVNAVCPGSISTPLTAQYTTDESFLESLKQTVPLGRPGTAPEVAEVIHFLLSRRSAYVSGAVVPVDGGWSASKSFAAGDNPIFTARQEVTFQ